mgnify:CR=1 FL=1
MNTMTITVDTNEGEQVYFKLLPLTSLEEFMLNVGDIECVSDVEFGVDNGLWEIH